MSPIRLLVFTTKEKVIEMSGGDQCNESQPCVADLVVHTPQLGIPAIVRAIIDECARDPLVFVDNEQAGRGK